VQERGSATLWVLAAGLLLVLVGVAGAAVGSARMARHQAVVAADLAALAGAARAGQGEGPACARAAGLAAANRAALVGCRTAGLDVTVTTQVAVSPLPGLRLNATAQARAGPVRTLE
jgi:secretion/DNA translocation related TadE-like protein